MQIGQDLCLAGMVGMTTKNVDVQARAILCESAERLADLATDKKGSPVVIRRFAFIPTSIAKGWDMSRHDDLSSGFVDLMQFRRQSFRGRFTQLDHQVLPMARVQTSKVFDGLKVIEPHIGVRVVSLSAISPAIFTDQVTVLPDQDGLLIREINQRREITSERGDRLSSCRD